jgi:hypothetical protein
LGGLIESLFPLPESLLNFGLHCARNLNCTAGVDTGDRCGSWFGLLSAESSSGLSAPAGTGFRCRSIGSAEQCAQVLLHLGGVDSAGVIGERRWVDEAHNGVEPVP